MHGATAFDAWSYNLMGKKPSQTSFDGVGLRPQNHFPYTQASMNLQKYTKAPNAIVVETVSDRPAGADSRI